MQHKTSWSKNDYLLYHRNKIISAHSYSIFKPKQSINILFFKQKRRLAPNIYSMGYWNTQWLELDNVVIDNSPYRLIFDLGESRQRRRNSRKEPFKSSKISKFGNFKKFQKYGKYSLTKFANFLIIVLRAEIVTIFEPKVVAIFARNTIMRKFANFVRLYFPHITTFSKPNFGILLLLKGSFRECSFFGRDLSN